MRTLKSYPTLNRLFEENPKNKSNEYLWGSTQEPGVVVELYNQAVKPPVREDNEWTDVEWALAQACYKRPKDDGWNNNWNLYYDSQKTDKKEPNRIQYYTKKLMGRPSQVEQRRFTLHILAS